MKAKGISIVCGVIVAFGLGACSDSQPTAPVTGQSMNKLYTSVDGDGNGMYEQETAEGPTGSTGSQQPGQPTYSDVNGASGSGSTGGSTSQGPTSVRPIQQFIDMQGTFCAPDASGSCASYMGHTDNYLAWFDESQNRSVAIDYAGIASRWLAARSGRMVGTTLDGNIVEQALPDGRARVTIDLKGFNVMSYMVKEAFLADGSVVFGKRVDQLFDPSVEPALGNISMRIVFINSAMGAPIPDLIQLIRAPQGGQLLESISMSYDGKGTMMYPAPNAPKESSAQISVNYDGSRGPVYPAYPGTDGTTPPMGSSSISTY